MFYLDHAAATPLHPKALQVMLSYFTTDFFNPSAPYLPAKHVREAYEAAKDQIAHTIGAKGTDLVITAGATESINLAFTAIEPSAKILTLATEHTAVLETAKQHPHSLIKVDSTGLIDLVDFRQQLDDDVSLVSVSLANNELGTIQPLAEISSIIREVKQSRLERGIKRPLYLHSDASQALSLVDLNVARLGVDLLTLNAAKCGGPKGVGALYLSHGVKLRPLTYGGGQERGLRSGTENVPGVIGFATAATESKSHLASRRKEYQKMAQILRQTLSQIPYYATKTLPLDGNLTVHTSIVSQNTENVKHKPHSTIPEPIFLGNPKHQLASFVPVCFSGIDAERLIYKLEMQEVFVSTGAACAANKGTKSHVLAAIGLSDAEIAGSLRISLGSTNTIEQIQIAAQIIAETVVQEYQRLGFTDASLEKLKASGAFTANAGGVSRHNSYFHQETIRSATSEEEVASARNDGLEEHRVSGENKNCTNSTEGRADA